MNKLVIQRPDDWHLHLRDGAVLQTVAPLSSKHFGRAIIMPNIVPPVTNIERAHDYRQAILDAVPPSHEFEPLMALYLTETTSRDDIKDCFQSGIIKAIKLFPAGATTNSENGVRDIKKVMPVLEEMIKCDLPLLVHGEVTDEDIDVFDREAVFIDRVLGPLRKELPELRIVLEHVTTATGVDYVMSSNQNLAASITPHHLLLTRDSVLAGGLRPHNYCLPIPKGVADRLAIRKAATSGNRKFFFGSDSAPHPDKNKVSTLGKAGIFNAANALSCLAAVFEQEGKLEQLEAFVSLNGSAFYGVSPNLQTITLRRSEKPLSLLAKIRVGGDTITVFGPEEVPLYWYVAA